MHWSARVVRRLASCKQWQPRKRLWKDDLAVVATNSNDQTKGDRIEDLSIVVTNLNVQLEELSDISPQLLVRNSLISRWEGAPKTRTLTVLHQEGCKSSISHYEDCSTRRLSDLVLTLGSPGYIREDKPFCVNTPSNKYLLRRRLRTVCRGHVSKTDRLVTRDELSFED